MAAISDVASGLRATLETVFAATQFDAGGIYLRDEHDGYRLQHHRGLSDDFVNAAAYFHATSDNAKLVAAGEPVFTVHHEVGVPLSEAERGEGLLALAAVPFKHGDRVIGCLNVTSRKMAEIPPFTREVLVAICANLGMAVSRILNEQEIRDHRAQLEKLVAERTEELETARDQAVRERDFSNALLDSLPGVFYVLDANGQVRRWNSNFSNVTGYSSKELNGLSALELFAGADKQLIGERIGRVFEEGAGFAEAELIAKDGSATPYYFTGTRIVMDGEPRLLGVGIDISLQKRASEDLATIFEMSLNPICIADIDTATFTRVNPAFEAVLGYTPEELLGKPFLEFIHPDDIAPTLAVIEEKLKAGARVLHFENRYRAKDGTYRWLDWVSNPVPARGLTYASAYDVTERKSTEAKLQDLIASLARSNEDLEQFAYVASHDLQEPLRMVASYTQLLAQRYQGQLDAKADMYIGFAVDGAKRMQGLIDDLLEFSRVGSRGAALLPTDCDEVVKELLRGLETTIGETGAKVVVGELPTVLADRTQLGQVFQNLITNAIKFHGEATPTVRVTAKRRGDFWEFTVSDNGIGIDPRFFDRIFTIFQRLHERDKYPGSGIGLAIVKKIVERHGGNIRVESTPGEGSRFIFTVPSASGARH